MGLAYVHRNKPDSSNALSHNSRRGKMHRFRAVDTELPDNQEDRSSVQCAYIELCQYTHTALATRAHHPTHMQWTCPSLRRGFGWLFARVLGIRAVLSRYSQIVLFADGWLSAKGPDQNGAPHFAARILRAIWRPSRHPQKRSLLNRCALRTMTPVTSIMDRAYVHRNKPASSNSLSDNSRSGGCEVLLPSRAATSQKDRSSIQ